MTDTITHQPDIESLKLAAAWPDADRATLVVLAARFASIGADAEAYSYFQQQADAQPGQALPLAIAGYFQARLGEAVDEALAKLDKAATADLGLPQYFRGLTLAGIPQDRHRAEKAVEDLEFVLAVRDQFPLGLLRAVHCALSAAYATLGKVDSAAEAWRRSGLGSVPWNSRLLVGSFSVTPDEGFRFTSPRIFSPVPDVHVAQGYDFADFAFIKTGEGVIAIDAGTAEHRVRVARDEVDLPPGSRISHLILTHAHFDHVGGIGALVGPGTQVIAQTGFRGELDRLRQTPSPFRYFFGDAAGSGPDIVPDQLITKPTPMTIGGTELVLYPTRGGETDDALMIHLPASGLLFTGDVMMPYVGNPFAAEGSPEGLLDALRFIQRLHPSALIQGHTPLTEVFTIETVPGLETALAELHGRVLEEIHAGRALPDILNRGHLPDQLREHPLAVMPYLVMRNGFAARLFHQRTGYWQADGHGLQPFTATEQAAALDLLAGGEEDRFVAAATELLDRGDHALALHLIQPGLLRHPASTVLAQLRQTALHRLLDQSQQIDPFRFLIYAELGELEIGPIH